MASQWTEPLRSVARTPFRYLADEIDDDEGPEILASATVDYIPQDGVHELIIPLKAVKKVYCVAWVQYPAACGVSKKVIRIVSNGTTNS